MKANLEKEIRFLKIYAIVLTLFLGVFAVAAFTFANQKQKFAEIDVERINIVERDDKLKMVISNKERLPDNIVAGKILPRHDRSPGILFYTEEGDECGGLLFTGQKKDGKIEADSSLTFDQYQQDQTVELAYSDSDNYRLVGLRIKDRPDIPLPDHIAKLEAVSKMKEGPERSAAMKPLLAPDRVFVGKSNGNAAVFLFDREGKPRIKMVVDAAGVPKIEFLDATGKVVQRLPETSGATKN